MSINEYIAKQFAHPRGIGGRIVMAVMNRQNVAMYDATEMLLQPQNGETILDIGCGNGIMLERLSRTCDCSLIGTDISEDALALAKQRVAGKQAELFCCSVDDMPIESATVDKAFSINTLYFWNDLPTAFAEIARVLKPDGVFIGTHYTSRTLDSYAHTEFGYRKYSVEEVVPAAHAGGFATDIRPVMNGRAYCLICNK